MYGIESTVDYKELKETSLMMSEFLKGFYKTDDVTGQGTMTTQLFAKYNLLMHPFPIFHKLYHAISEAFHLSLNNYYGKKVSDPHFIQCWLNVYSKGEYIDWHAHQPPIYKSWHGIFCVDTEPGSCTSYRWPNNITRKDFVLDIPNKDGLIIMGLSDGDEHRSSEWQFEDRKRVTIAFDIVPARAFALEFDKYPEPKFLNAVNNIKNGKYYLVNHWIPI